MKSQNLIQRFFPAFAAIILTSIIQVFKGYWWDDNFQSIMLIFIGVSLVHALAAPYTSRALLYVLDGLIAITVIAQVTSHRFHLVDEQLLLFEKIFAYLWNVKEIIAIVTIFVVLQLFLSNWVKSKLRLTLFFSIALITVCIVDSFTPLRLWLEVIIIIVTFLIWHSCLHLVELQRSNNERVITLLKKPLSIIFPMITLLALIVIISTNLPSRPPLLEDPYALWKKSQGEAVGVDSGEIYDSGVSSPVRGPLDRTTSGYSRSDRQLGGGFDFDYTPIMTVTTSHKSYWRGESRFYYDGKGWQDYREWFLADDAQSGVMLYRELTGYERPRAETIEVEQDYRFLTKMPLPVMFGAGQISTITGIGFGDIEESLKEWEEGGKVEKPKTEVLSLAALLPATWVPGDWRIELEGEGFYDNEITNYSLKSEVIIIDHEGLRNAESQMSDINREYDYTYIGPTVPQRVYDLAEEITADAKNDYEAILLLERYLKLNFKYTNHPDTLKLTGTSEDFVDQFLFELKEGYCDYFSTSMAIMARTLGFPTRWVKGFSSGISDRDEQNARAGIPYWEQMQNNDTSGTYTVRNADAHSWVEVYFEGYGWIAFEPTPGFSFPYTYIDEQNNPLLDLEIEPSEPMLKPESSAVKEEKVTIPSWIIWCSVLIVGIALLLVFIKFRHTIIALIQKYRYGNYSSSDRIILEMKGFMKACHRIGLERTGNQTLREAIVGWKFGSEEWQSNVMKLLDVYERAYFSNEDFDENQLLEVKKLINTLKKEMSFKKKQ